MDDPFARVDYEIAALDESTLDPSPIEQLRTWLAEAGAAGVREPEGMCVCTATPDGDPSGRIVLLRGLDGRGLAFFTNFESRKAFELGANPRAAAVFWWPSLERQVRVEGAVSRVSTEESDAYFRSRPLESRLSAIVSPQSGPIDSRKALEERWSEARSRLGPDPPRPEFWGGFRLAPTRFEFWQGRPARLHDRLVYELLAGDWRVRRLAP